MALTWDNSSRKDQSGKVVSESYRARLPHWGEASVHPHIHHQNCTRLYLDDIMMSIMRQKDDRHERQFAALYAADPSDSAG